MITRDYDHVSNPLLKVKDPTPYIAVCGSTPSISAPLRQVVNNESISIGSSSKKSIIPNLNLTPPSSPGLTCDNHSNLKCPNEPKDPNEFKLPPYASIARASSSLEPQTTTTDKQKSPMPTETSSTQKNKAASSLYSVYPDHQCSMRDGFSGNIHHTQRIPLIENYFQSLGREERRQFIHIEESAVKECGNNIMGNQQSSLQQMNIEHNKIENCKGTPAKASSSCPMITFQAMIKMMMGESNYKVARDTIINHQHIFAQQVSDLHRIIEVQKELINSSSTQQSNHPKSDTSLLPKPTPKAPVFNNSSRNEASTIQIMGTYPAPTPDILGRPCSYPQPTNLTGLHTNSNSNNIATNFENIRHHHETQCFPPIENYRQDLGREGRRQLIPIKESTTKRNPPAPEKMRIRTPEYGNVGNNTIINHMPPLYLPSHGNQLLCPIISPTEGLIYKLCPSLPNQDYTYIDPYSSIQNMKSLSECSLSPSSCVIRDERNPNEVKDTENVNSTPTSPKENNVPKNVGLVELIEKCKNDGKASTFD